MRKSVDCLVLWFLLSIQISRYICKRTNEDGSFGERREVSCLWGFVAYGEHKVVKIDSSTFEYKRYPRLSPRLLLGKFCNNVLEILVAHFIRSTVSLRETINSNFLFVYDSVDYRVTLPHLFSHSDHYSHSVLFSYV